FDGDNVHGGATAFVARLNMDLSQVEAATYLGESSTEQGYGVALAPDGSVYATGLTVGPNFPTTDGAYDRTGGPFEDVFISHLDNELSQLIASTLVPNGWGLAVAIDASGNVFLAGQTYHQDYPTTPGAYDDTCGCSGGFPGNVRLDVVLSQLNDGLTTLEASTFLGGGCDDILGDIEVDGSGGVYVSGTSSFCTSSSSPFPTTSGAYQTASNNGAGTVFVSRMNVDLTTLEASTVVGGSDSAGGSEGFDMELDGDYVYVAGETFSEDYPTTPDAVDMMREGANEVIVSVLDRDLSMLEYSTFLGGIEGPRPEEDQGRAIAVGPDGSILVSGQTISPTFPTTPGAFQETGAGDFDGFVSSIESFLPTAQEGEGVPTDYTLGQNYPNPFNPST
ncbi:MAG: hypothetical protein R3330_17160, partial [Saprospiraceae bacterium]|nr:hypothetical protein [Saprospiraceae bacterium]